MLINVHGAGDGNQHQCQKLMACVQALEEYGHRIVHYRNGQSGRECSMALFWGHRTERFPCIEQYQVLGIPYLVIEQGFTGDRLDNTTMGWNGLNGCAFRPPVPDGDSAISYEPWHKGETIIVMGQLAGDASLRGEDIRTWCGWAARVIKERFPDNEVVIRPHPKTPIADGEVRPGMSTILKTAKLIVTYSSNAGVDAIRAGVPAIAYHPGSMVWDVAGQGLDAGVTTPCRREWAREMHWAEWPVERLADGVGHNMQVWEEARDRARAGCYDRRNP